MCVVSVCVWDLCACWICVRVGCMCVWDLCTCGICARVGSVRVGFL